MSFLGETTAFLIEDENGVERAPKIVDIKAWKDFCVENDYLADNAVVKEKAEGNYPKKQYKHLKGFKCVDKEDAAYVGFNIDNLAYNYKSEKFPEILKDLSEVLETPFSFYHSEGDGHWPRLDADIVWRVAEENRSLPSVYHITVYEDSIEVEEAKVQMSEFENTEIVEFAEEG